MALIRPEKDDDAAAVHAVLAGAYAREAEARLVEEMRHSPAAVLSLVAVRFGQVIGYAFFSRVVICHEVGYDHAVALDPLAVVPEHQHSGVGTDLVRYGMAALRNRCHGVLLARGDPAFFRRLGFHPAERDRLHCDRADSPSFFHAFRLDQDWLGGRGGRVRYAMPFQRLPGEPPS